MNIREEETFERVKALMAACPENVQFADMSDSIQGLYDIGGPTNDPDNMRFQKIAMPAEYEDGSDPRWKLLEHAPDLARLCLSLAAQLQQEREARERVGQLALKAHAAESAYADLEAIERHMVLPQIDWEAHSLAVDKAYSLAQQAAWLVVHAALAPEPQ